MKLEVKYVYEQKGEVVGPKKVKFTPVGVGHIAEPVQIELSGKALCGKDVSRIRHRKITTRFIDGVDLCEACKEAWKKHPQSEWARWSGA